MQNEKVKQFIINLNPREGLTTIRYQNKVFQNSQILGTETALSFRA